MTESIRAPIGGGTKLLGVCGYPVEHSLSPAMHNAAISALGLDFVYVPFSVRPDDVGDAVRAMVPLGIVGLNLTIPHKERILPFLDHVDLEAQRIGAVNTVHNVGGVLHGCSTDARGFAAPLAGFGLSLQGLRTLVIGAGGAARSIVFLLASMGGRVTLANRTVDRAKRLADEVLRSLGVPVEWIELADATSLKAATGAAEMVVNTTSVGMWPSGEDTLPVPQECLHSGQVVYDLIYRPLETRLLAAARECGARTLNGVGMLVHQGAASFEVWTGVQPPVDVMERAVMRELGSK